MSGQDFRKTTERDLTVQVLEAHNGQWLYRHQIVEQIQRLDRRFSAQAIRKALEDLVTDDLRMGRKHGAGGGVMYGCFDPARRVSTRTSFDDLPIRPSSSAADLEWPDE